MNEKIAISSSETKNPWELMLIALSKSNIDTIKNLMTHYPEILDMKNVDGETLLMIAVQYQDMACVNVLLTHGVSLDDISDRKDHWSYRKTALQQAIALHHYDIAYAIVLKKTEHQPETAILPFIIHIDMLLFALRQEPSLIRLFMPDERIKSLIYDYLKDTNQKTIDIYHMEALSRRPSFFKRINPESGQIDTFSPRKFLGQGVFGTVRMFENRENNEKIAIKSSHIITNSQTDINLVTKSKLRETEISGIAYPSTSHSLFHFYIKQNETACARVEYRQVIPYLEGERASDVMSRTHNLDELAQMILCIAKELQRLHNAGIIHGDFHLQNVLIDKKCHREIISNSVDFGLSCLITDQDSLSIFIGCAKSHAPPELRVSRIEKMKPTFSQDIYIFGYALKHQINPEDLHELDHHFPSIQHFITASQHENPEQRPSLTSFCTDLENELRARTQDQKMPCWTHHKKRKWIPTSLEENNGKENQTENDEDTTYDDHPIIF